MLFDPYSQGFPTPIPGPDPLHVSYAQIPQGCFLSLKALLTDLVSSEFASQLRYEPPVDFYQGKPFVFFVVTK